MKLFYENGDWNDHGIAMSDEIIQALSPIVSRYLSHGCEVRDISRVVLYAVRTMGVQTQVAEQ